MSDEKLRRHQARAKAETHPQVGASAYDGASRTKKMVTMAMMVAISDACIPDSFPDHADGSVSGV